MPHVFPKDDFVEPTASLFDEAGKQRLLGNQSGKLDGVWPLSLSISFVERGRADSMCEEEAVINWTVKN